jgi:hypothetical protein
VAEILHQVFDPVDAARVPALLLVLGDCPHGPQRSEARLLWRQAIGQALLNLAFEMILQFLIEILLDLPGAEQGAQQKAKLYEPP